MAVYPKTLRKNAIPGEMEQRQEIARGYKVGPKGKIALSAEKLHNYITYIYLPIGVVVILAACMFVMTKMIGPISLVIATLLWAAGYFVLAKIDGVKNVQRQDSNRG